MRRTLASAMLLAVVLPVASACGDDEAAPAMEAGQPEPKTIEVTFSGSSVTPSGERVELAQGQDVEFIVKSDAAGELHVHTSPEKSLAYSAGTTTIQLPLDEPPGVVEVESHDLDQVVVQLEIR